MQFTVVERVACSAPYRGEVGHHLRYGVLQDGTVAYLTGATGVQGVRQV